MVLSFIIVLGLIFGSFINALVWRMRKKRKWWGSERSICPKCKHKLSAQDLIPIISWLVLKGKCRYCHKPISIQYPLVELLTAVLFGISYCFWPVGFSSLGLLAFIVWLFCIVVMVALLVYDYLWLLLPNKMVSILTIASLILVVLMAINNQSLSYMINALVAGLVFFGLLFGLLQISDGKWIGGGDVKMAFALGLIAGSATKAILLLFLASFIGSLLTVPLLITKRLSLKAKVPFGPLLIIATILVFLFGSQLINWYTSTFLYI